MFQSSLDLGSDVDSGLGIVDETPVEEFFVRSIPVLVKREDLCCPGGPPFSKIRGVVSHLRARPERTIGVLDTSHSKAGWAVSYVCLALGKATVNYYPIYAGKVTVPPQQAVAQGLGAYLVPLQAGRSAILYHRAKKHLSTFGTDTYMMPNALKLEESVGRNAAEFLRTVQQLPPAATLVVSMSSGTVAAGILRGLAMAGLVDAYRMVVHLGYSRPLQACQKYIELMSGVSGATLTFIDEGYGYADWVDTSVPFPCNAYYDAKAWKWLVAERTLDAMTATGPVVFWNIGA